MAIKTTSLVTLADARAFIGKKVTEITDDAIIEELVDGVSDRIGTFVARSLALATDTTLLIDGNGRPRLFLPRYPIVSIGGIAEDDQDLVEGNDEDYVIYKSTGILSRVEGIWSVGNQNIELTNYVGGYVVQGQVPTTGQTALPSDIRLACLTQVASDYQSFLKKDWNESSRSFPDGSVSKVQTDDLLAEVRKTLARYRAIRV